MSEIVGVPGKQVAETGIYACSKCGFRPRLVFAEGSVFPQAHCEEAPWMLMVRDADPAAHEA